MTESSALEIYLTEYKSLKDEQRARIATRDRHVYVMLTVTAAITYFSLGGFTLFTSVESTTRHMALFLLPPAGIILGWVYLVNDWKVSELGRYFRDKLAAALSTRTGLNDALAWEELHRTGAHRRYRKVAQLVVDLLVFYIPGAVALVVYWVVTADVSALFVAVTVLECAGLTVLAVEIIRHADVASESENE